MAATELRSTDGGVRVGVDIGGTFTDLVLAECDGTLHVNKLSSTPQNPGAAVIAGLEALLAQAGATPEAVTEIVHGTTIASNTILQMSGPRTGLITTRGFRDVLEIGRIRTPEMFDLTWDKPRPLIDRRDRVEVDERIGADGDVVRPLALAEAVAAAERLVAAGVESLAIVFLNSYVNPAHERQAEAAIRERFPGLPVSASYRVLPEIKEYERTSTTAVNAYLLPVMRDYLNDLVAGLERIGVRAPLMVVASNGGVLGLAAAAEKPVFAVGSGPAAGVAGAARLGRRSGAPDVIAFDMGGTTAKASLVEDGQVTLTTEYEFRAGISTSSRFIKAGGYMLKAPAIDIAEVGAGAGSIAHADAGGLLRVGPQSAGADPGPACYGLGGTAPTVADANVVLGYLNPRYLAGGTLEIDSDLAVRAIDTQVAGPLGLDPVAAAHGIRAVANANMARALRAVSVERGRDPRELTLMAFGGAGAAHAADLAEALDIRRILVPELPGVFTAVGMLASDIEHHLVRAHGGSIAGLDPAAANAVLDELERDARAALAAEGYGGAAGEVRFKADLRYAGQSSELTVAIPGRRLAAADAVALGRAFAEQYAQNYGYVSAGEVPELVNLRAVAIGRRASRLEFGGLRVAETPGAGPKTGRPVHFQRGCPPVETPVLPRAVLDDGPLTGPAILESYDSTIAVPPGWAARRDACGNVAIERPGV